MEPEGSIFQKTLTQYSFHLPKYQRRYEWVEEQWEDFWSSISEAYGTDINTYKDVFLGSFVFQQVKAGDMHLVVVDGQQRIVTVFLLLALIRDINSQNAIICDEINSLILQNPKKFRTQEINGKILLSEIDTPSFHKIINGLFESEHSSDLIYRGYEWFRNRIKSNHYSLDFDRLKYCILNHLKFAQVILDRYEDAGLMFYTLNFGGKDLEKLDVIRHVFFSYMDPSKFHEYHDRYWHPVEMALYQKQPKILDFIKTVMQYQGWKLNSNNIVKDLSRNIRHLDKSKQQENAQNFLRSMHHQWDLYCWLISPEKINDNFAEEKRRLIRLNFLNHKDSFPIFLKAFNLCNYNSKPTKDDKSIFLEILKTIETFFVRNYVCGDIIKIPDSFIKLLRYNTISQPQEYLEKIKEILGENLPKDESFKVSLVQSSLYCLGDDKIGRLLLFALDDYLSGGDSGLIWNHKGYSTLIPEFFRRSIRFNR